MSKSTSKLLAESPSVALAYQNNCFNTSFRVSTLIAALCVFVTLLFSTSSSATQQDLAAEEAEYLSVLSGSNFQQQKRALEVLSWSAVDSEPVFDAIADKLVSLKDAKGKQEKQEAAWFAKALAYSGKEKYRPVLSMVAADGKSKKARKYASQALSALDDYIAWNPIISANIVNAPEGKLQQHRVSNMLSAQDPMLLRLGAKRVYHGHKNDEALVAAAAKRLESEYQAMRAGDDAQEDAVAWLIKVLAESGDKQYQPLLATIAKTADNKKVKKYAEKYQAYLL